MRTFVDCQALRALVVGNIGSQFFAKPKDVKHNFHPARDSELVEDAE